MVEDVSTIVISMVLIEIRFTNSIIVKLPRHRTRIDSGRVEPVQSLNKIPLHSCSSTVQSLGQ